MNQLASGTTISPTGCCGSRNNKICPIGRDAGFDLIEVRPNRTLRIRHVNPSPRDEIFERHMKERIEIMEKEALERKRPKSRIAEIRRKSK